MYVARKTSLMGRKFIKNNEGVRYFPYKDSGGRWTIGIGHLMNPIEILSKKYNKGITAAQCEALFISDLEVRETQLNLALTLANIQVTQNQFDALMDFVFNLGIVNLVGSTLFKYMKQGLWMESAREFPKWCKVKDAKTGKMVIDQGVFNRRLKDKQLFMSNK